MKINVDENEREKEREKKTKRTMRWIDAFLFQDIIHP